MENIYKALEILDSHFDVVRNCYAFNNRNEIVKIHKLLEKYVQDKEKESKKVPELRIDCYKDHVEVFEEGKQQRKVKEITFSASVNDIPEYTLTKNVDSDGCAAVWNKV